MVRTGVRNLGAIDTSKEFERLGLAEESSREAWSVFQPFPWRGPMLTVIISVGKSRVSRIGCSVEISSLDTEAALLRDHSLGATPGCSGDWLGSPGAA